MAEEEGKGRDPLSLLKQIQASRFVALSPQVLPILPSSGVAEAILRLPAAFKLWRAGGVF